MSLVPGAASARTWPSDSHHCSAARRWAPVEAAGDLVSEAEVGHSWGVDRVALGYILRYIEHCEDILLGCVSRQ